MTAVVREGGAQIVGSEEESAALALAAARLQPDAVILGREHAHSREAGHPTREVARQPCYSERTVKNVLHDVVTKLNARSRSQAVAFAVREGLI